MTTVRPNETVYRFLSPRTTLDGAPTAELFNGLTKLADVSVSAVGNEYAAAVVIPDSPDAELHLKWTCTVDTVPHPFRDFVGRVDSAVASRLAPDDQALTDLATDVAAAKAQATAAAASATTAATESTSANASSTAAAASSATAATQSTEAAQSAATAATAAGTASTQATAAATASATAATKSTEAAQSAATAATAAGTASTQSTAAAASSATAATKATEAATAATAANDKLTTERLEKIDGAMQTGDGDDTGETLADKLADVPKYGETVRYTNVGTGEDHDDIIHTRQS